MDNKVKKAISAKQEEITSRQLEEHIQNKATKCLQTAFVFAIAEIEREFGHLWKFGEDDESKLTDRDRYYEEIFEKVRKNIFDNGNKQMRRLKKELENVHMSQKNFIYEVNPNE